MIPPGSSSIDVVLPVLDEAAAIPGVLDAFPVGYRPIVVDNGSSDGSDLIAAELGAAVVHEPHARFRGRLLRRAVGGELGGGLLHGLRRLARPG